jgi:hypothetical protein
MGNALVYFVIGKLLWRLFPGHDMGRYIFLEMR